MLVAQDAGQYRFLPGIEPYSAGVVAGPGTEIVHATLAAPVPWRAGFAQIERHLERLGRPRAALCAVQLRLPAPLPFEGFVDFNRGYRALLSDWGLLVDGQNPIARTNVVPVVGAPAEASLYAFSYTVPAAPGTPATFVVAGSGELRPGFMSADGIVRRGEVSAEALRDKAAYVMGVMEERLAGLGMSWAGVSAVSIYTPHPIEPFAVDTVLRPMGPAAVHGLRWFPSRPPIRGLEYEMDARGVCREIRLGGNGATIPATS
ncbi:MAG: hypothetical protein DMD79_09715 [Candidatus Rokuibacteriota bacterium]|nr:MAG: hypothetical protein DMD79_09715 [Candidatus Rokubacteria bacterium]